MPNYYMCNYYILFSICSETKRKRSSYKSEECKSGLVSMLCINLLHMIYFRYTVLVNSIGYKMLVLCKLGSINFA